MTNEQIEIVLTKYKEGMSYSKIALLIDRSENAVKHWLRANREAYGLMRRRDYKHKTNAVSETVEAMCTWNLASSRKWLTKKWGEAA